MSVVRVPGAAGISDPGLTRTGNEDALLVEPPLFAVADGMGGHRAGEIASRVAMQGLLAAAPRGADAKALGRAVRAANRAVIESAAKSRSRSGMGTTLTSAMVDGTHVVIAHVGDSRAYLLHQGRLTRVTEDHSLVADLVRQGSLTEEEARFHPQRSVITRALGSDPEMAADTFELDAEPGDRLLLTTDGLTGMLPDDYIAELLLQERDPGTAAEKLVEAANRAGGYDNITAIVVDIGDEAAAAPGRPVRRTESATRRRAARVLWLVVALAFIGAAIGGAVSYARSRAYLVDQGGYVAVYRGIPGSFAGLSLSWPVEETTIAVSMLDAPQQDRLANGVQFASLSDALARVDALRTESQAASTTTTGTVGATSTPAP